MPATGSQTEGLSMQASVHFVQWEMMAYNSVAAPDTLDSCRLQNNPQATQEKHLQQHSSLAPLNYAGSISGSWNTLHPTK